MYIYINSLMHAYTAHEQLCTCFQEVNSYRLHCIIYIIENMLLHIVYITCHDMLSVHLDLEQSVNEGIDKTFVLVMQLFNDYDLVTFRESFLCSVLLSDYNFQYLPYHYKLRTAHTMLQKQSALNLENVQLVSYVIYNMQLLFEPTVVSHYAEMQITLITFLMSQYILFQAYKTNV